MATNNRKLKTKIEELEQIINTSHQVTINKNKTNKSKINTNQTTNKNQSIRRLTNLSISPSLANRRNINKTTRDSSTKPEWRNTLTFSSVENVEKLKRNIRNYQVDECTFSPSMKIYKIPANVQYEEIKEGSISGGYGDVFKALWTVVSNNSNSRKTREVAIKHFRSAKEFQYEMGVVEKIRDLNIDALIEFIAADSEQNIIVYEWLDTDYHEYVRKYGEIPPAYWLLTMYKLVYGLADIHSKNMIHRDIKPENLLCKISNPFYIKYGDLGSCCYCSDVKKCRSKTAYGTSYFINREKSSNLFKRDIFALGLSVYEIFTGRTINAEYRVNVNDGSIKKNKNNHTNEEMGTRIPNIMQMIKNIHSNNKNDQHGIVNPIELDRIEYRLNNQIMNIGTYIRWMLDPIEERRPTAKDLLRRMIRDYPEIFSKLH